MSTESTGRLYVVATPIGNLEDITLRALRVLKEADMIVAEDTRRTRILCTHYAIQTPVRSFHAHTTDAKLHHYIEKLQQGQHIALVTDAGTPLVSDPGANLVSEAIAAGVVVDAIPGATAVTTALCVSGVTGDSFAFLGFVPRTSARRKELFRKVQQSQPISIFFESPRRLEQTLQELGSYVGEQHMIAVCRELTKMHEEVIRGPLQDVLTKLPNPIRGEITVVVAGHSREELGRSSDDDFESIDASIQQRLAEGQTPRDIARLLSEATGLPKKDLYRRVLQFVE